MNLIEQYKEVIVTIIGVLIVVAPNLITRVINDKRLNNQFQLFKREVSDKVLIMGKIEKLYDRMIDAVDQVESYKAKINEMIESNTTVSNENLKLIKSQKLLIERLEEKDKTIQWLSKEIKDIKVAIKKWFFIN